MAGRTNTELILELRDAVTVLNTRLDHLYQTQGRHESDAARVAEAVAGIDKRLAVVESYLADLKRAAEERERQRWSVWVLVAGSALTLVVNLLLLLLKK